MVVEGARAAGGTRRFVGHVVRADLLAPTASLGGDPVANLPKTSLAAHVGSSRTPSLFVHGKHVRNWLSAHSSGELEHWVHSERPAAGEEIVHI